MIAQKNPGQAVKNAKATSAWGIRPPDWILALAREIDATSNARAAKRIGYSSAVANSIVSHTYRGDYPAVEQAVRGALMDQTVDCPVVGEINADQCSANQRRKLNPTNPRNVRLWRACHHGGCPHSRVDNRKGGRP